MGKKKAAEKRRTPKAAPLVTLTTDFGAASPYVAAMKGVLLGINPRLHILDLSHQIPPQDVRHAAFFLAAAVPFFPPDVLHVVVVDPGVGSERALLYVEVGGHRLLAPDNGCWTELARAVASPPTVIRLAEPRWWRPLVSATFHGRDILAPVAAHLSLGLDSRQLGPLVSEWVILEARAVEVRPDGLMGEVVFVDDFGNLLTNLPGNALDDPTVCIFVETEEIGARGRTYADVPPGTLLALRSSTDRLEIAVAHGSAAVRLRAGVGASVRVQKTRVTEPAA